MIYLNSPSHLQMLGSQLLEDKYYYLVVKSMTVLYRSMRKKRKIKTERAGKVLLAYYSQDMLSVFLNWWNLCTTLHNSFWLLALWGNLRHILNMKLGLSWFYIISSVRWILAVGAIMYWVPMATGPLFWGSHPWSRLSTFYTLPLLKRVGWLILHANCDSLISVNFLFKCEWQVQPLMAIMRYDNWTQRKASCCFTCIAFVRFTKLVI